MNPPKLAAEGGMESLGCSCGGCTCDTEFLIHFDS